MEEGQLVLVVRNKSNHTFEIDEFATIEGTPEQFEGNVKTYLISQNGRTDWIDPEDIANIKDAMISKSKIRQALNIISQNSWDNGDDVMGGGSDCVSFDLVYAEINKLLE